MIITSSISICSISISIRYYPIWLLYVCMFNVLVPGTCSLLTMYIVVHDIDLFRTASFVVNKSDMNYITF